MSTIIIAKPSSEPITVAEVQEFARIDDGVDDTIIGKFITAARETIETFINSTMLNTSYRYVFDAGFMPDYEIPEGYYQGYNHPRSNNCIILPKSPLVSVSSIKSYSRDGTATVFDANNYYLDTASRPGRVLLKDGKQWPSNLRANNSIEVDFVAGFGDTPADVPMALRVALMGFVAYLYENRGDNNMAVPANIKQSLQQYRVFGGVYENK